MGHYDPGDPTEARPPPGGWPPMPWDHAYLRSSDGSESRVAVDLDGIPIVDADGSHVMTGPGFAHRPVKARWTAPSPEVPLEVDGLSEDGRRCIEAAYDISLDHGHPWVGTEHLTLAVLRMRPELGTRVGLPVAEEVEAAIARFYDGPAAQERLRRVEARRAGELARPPSDGPRWNMALATTVRAASSLAGGSAGSMHLFVAELRGGRSLVLSMFEREGRDMSSVLQRARAIRDWLPLIDAVEEADD